MGGFYRQKEGHRGYWQREIIVWGQATLFWGAREQQGSCYEGHLTIADQDISDGLFKDHIPEKKLKGQLNLSLLSWEKMVTLGPFNGGIISAT